VDEDAPEKDLFSETDDAPDSDKQVKLTLLEEIVLLGLKDRQVCACSNPKFELMRLFFFFFLHFAGLPFVVERQHLVCAAWMHPDGAVAAWAH